MPISEYLARLRSRIGHDMVLMPGVTAVIHNAAGEVLVVRATDGFWGTPGGAIDPGEDAAAAVVREVAEELGIEVAPRRVLAVYRNLVNYPNGDVVEYHSVAFACDVIAGDPVAADGEIERWEWVTPQQATERGIALPAHVMEPGYGGVWFAQ